MTETMSAKEPQGSILSDKLNDIDSSMMRIVERLIAIRDNLLGQPEPKPSSDTYEEFKPREGLIGRCSDTAHVTSNRIQTVCSLLAEIETI